MTKSIPKKKAESNNDFDPPPPGIGRSLYPKEKMTINEWHQFIRAQNEKIRKMSSILK